MARRSRAREVALQLLFLRDQNPTPVPRPAIERFARERLLGDAGMVAYCLGLYDATLARQAEIDPKLTATATNWRLSRMLPVDRNVLRLAAYELLFDPERQPPEVVINEAIELAGRFGSADSPKFVNGVLDKIARLREEVPPGPNPATVAQPEQVTRLPENRESAPEPVPITPTPLVAGTSLRHRIAYHNTERMGRPLVDGNPLGVKTSKVTQNWGGDVVWFVQGDGEGERRYSLASVFVVDEAGTTGEEEFPWGAQGKHGHVFRPPIVLNELPWFPTLFRLMGHFGTCPQLLTDERIVRELLRRAADAGFSPV